MSNYTKIVDYAAKDALVTGNPAKVIKGTELGAEFDAISTAVGTKADTASPTFTGTVGLPIITVAGAATFASTITATGAIVSSGTIEGNGGGGNGLGKITVSSSSPSGGSNGDLWIVI